MSFELKPITILVTGRERVEVEAFVRGAFALHQGGIAWSVTHVPTGFALAKNLVSARVAAELIRAVEKFPEWEGVVDEQSALSAPKNLAAKVKLALRGLRNGVSLDALGAPPKPGAHALNCACSECIA